MYTPWYWAQHAGFTRELIHLPSLIQTYGSDPNGCRLTDTYIPAGEPAQTLIWHPQVPLGEAQLFMAVLRPQL